MTFYKYDYQLRTATPKQYGTQAIADHVRLSCCLAHLCLLLLHWATRPGNNKNPTLPATPYEKLRILTQRQVFQRKDHEL